MMQYSNCLSPHGVDLIPDNLPSRVWGSNDRFHFNTNGNCNNTNVLQNHQVTFVRYNTRMYHTNRQLPPAVIHKEMCSCFPPNPMLSPQRLVMTAIQQPPPPWPFAFMPQDPSSSRLVPSPLPSYQLPPLLRAEPASFHCNRSTILHDVPPPWDSCLQPITGSIVYNQPHQPSSQDKKLPLSLSKQEDPKLTKIPPLIDMSGIIEASTVDDLTLLDAVSPKPLCIVLEENDAYCELPEDSAHNEVYATGPCSIAGSNNVHVSSLIDANYVCVSETADINNNVPGTGIEPVSNYQLPFADFLDNASPLHSPEQLCDHNDPVPMEISLSDDEFDSQIPNHESPDQNCPSAHSIDNHATERELQSPLTVLVSQSDDDLLGSLPLPPSPDQIQCLNSQSPDVVEQFCLSPLVQSDNDSQVPSPDQIQCLNSPALPDVAGEEQSWSPLVLVSQCDDDLYSPVPSPNHMQFNSPSTAKDPLVVSIPLSILPQLQHPSPLVVSLPIEFWKNAKRKTKISNSQDDTMALQTLEEIFKSSTLLSVKDENLIRQFMKGEHIEWIDSNIMRYALSKVSNMAGDLEYATVELDLEQKQWRGIMINAEDAASFTFHNDNHITS